MCIENMKTTSKQLIVISIILLLIGVSVSSAISVDTQSTISSNESVEDCGCGEVSDADLIRVERLLDRVEVYSKLLLVLSRHNPEVLEDYEELSNDIELIKYMFKDFKSKQLIDDYPIICFILEIIYRWSWEKTDYYSVLFYESSGLLKLIYLAIGSIYEGICFYSFWTAGDLDCDFYP